MPIAIKPFRYRLVLLLSETILSLNATLNNKTCYHDKNGVRSRLFSVFYFIYNFIDNKIWKSHITYLYLQIIRYFANL